MSRTSVYDEARRLPLVVEPDAGDGAAPDLARWYAENRALVEAELRDRGAVLFRGFGVDTPGGFARFARGTAGGLLAYVDGNSPRTKLAAGVYTSTQYPAEFFISLHNELSYAHAWPSRLLFCCITPPASGGETPIADCRAVLRDLDPAVVEEFRRKGVKYLRRLHGGEGFGPSWQETFETKERAEVERYCREGSVEHVWEGDGSLRLAQTRPAVAKHPETGEEVWFNQADQFHPSTQPPAVRAALEHLFRGREGELPQDARFGDDTPIPAEALAEVQRTVMRNAVLFPWRQGDVLLLDNMLVCHGRMPFEGPRRVLVSMF